MNRRDIRTDYDRICADIRHAEKKARVHGMRICFSQQQTVLRPDGFLQFIGEPYLRDPAPPEFDTDSLAASIHRADQNTRAARIQGDAKDEG